MTILATSPWPTNADLINDLYRLRYLTPSQLTLDATYGEGKWWSIYRPPRLITNDLHKPADHNEDFRCLSFADCTFDCVVFDPTYVSAGGRATTTLPDFHNAYGMDIASRTPQLLQSYNNEGLGEMYRVLKWGGVCLTKCADYISSGNLFPGVFLTQLRAVQLGFTIHDVLIHYAESPRAQPSKRGVEKKESAQQHARHNSSTMLVLKKDRKGAKKVGEYGENCI